MTTTQDPIAHAARLLRETAEELRQEYTLSSDRNNWRGDCVAKAAYDEHMAAAQALVDWEAAVGAGGVQPLGSAQERCKLVPLEPTPEMLAAPKAAPGDQGELHAEALRLSEILIAMGQGSSPEPEELWADGYEPSDGDVYVHRAALVLAMLAASPPAEQPAPLSDDTKDAARWRWLSEHIGVAWNEGKFTSLVRIVSDKNRAALNASIDRMMTGDWSDAALAAHGGK